MVIRIDRGGSPNATPTTITTFQIGKAIETLPATTWPSSPRLLRVLVVMGAKFSGKEHGINARVIDMHTGSPGHDMVLKCAGKQCCRHR
jgi:hypothetical protein